jgi:hypothetical protein
VTSVARVVHAWRAQGGIALRSWPTQDAPCSPVNLFLLFEPHKWCLYEIGQARCSEEQTVGGLRKPMDGRCWGMETPGRPDSSRDVTRGVPDLTRGVASSLQLASASGHQRARRAKRRTRGQRRRGRTLCGESLRCGPRSRSVLGGFAHRSRSLWKTSWSSVLKSATKDGEGRLNQYSRTRDGVGEGQAKRQRHARGTSVPGAHCRQNL